MTNDEALALKDGDVIYLIDDSLEGSASLHNALRRIVIGESGRNLEPIRIKRETAYLLNAAHPRAFHPELFFADPQIAIAAFEKYLGSVRESILETLDAIDERFREASTMIKEEHRQHLESITHG